MWRPVMTEADMELAKADDDWKRMMETEVDVPCVRCGLTDGMSELCVAYRKGVCHECYNGRR